MAVSVMCGLWNKDGPGIGTQATQEQSSQTVAIATAMER